MTLLSLLWSISVCYSNNVSFPFLTKSGHVKRNQLLSKFPIYGVHSRPLYNASRYGKKVNALPLLFSPYLHNQCSKQVDLHFHKIVTSIFYWSAMNLAPSINGTTHLKVFHTNRNWIRSTMFFPYSKSVRWKHLRNHNQEDDTAQFLDAQISIPVFWQWIHFIFGGCISTAVSKRLRVCTSTAASPV